MRPDTRALLARVEARRAAAIADGTILPTPTAAAAQELLDVLKPGRRD
ncbi:hypothetical protein [Gordonia sp. (in: high G+C Gram-positive bacteria)]